MKPGQHLPEGQRARFACQGWVPQRCEESCCRAIRRDGAPGKIVYARAKDARRAAELAGKRAYLCRFCDHWHITSRKREVA